MPKVTVIAYSSLQQLLKHKTNHVRMSANSVMGLIEFLSTNFNAKIREELIEKNGGLNPRYQIFVNGKNIQYENGLDTSIGESDLIMISNVIDGG